MNIFLKTIVLAAVMTLLAACGSDFEWFPDSDSDTPAVNTAPVANAGTAQSVLIGDIVTLDGSASSDANGDSLTYSWSFTFKPTGSAAVLSSTTAIVPTFTPDVVGAYNLSLIVNDGKASSTAATVTINAFNAPPTANAGLDQTVVFSATVPVQLDGSASSGAIQSYNWSRQSASCGSLSSATVVNPTLTGSTAGTCVIELQVSNTLGSTTDRVSITVNPSNTGSITVTW